MSLDVFGKIQAIYDEASLRYTTLEAELGDAACGYDILYTPPVVKPDLMIIGLNPGGGAKDYVPTGGPEHRTWPKYNAYLESERSPLGKKLETALEPELLARSVGMNCIFVRSSGEKAYETLKRKTSLIKDFEAFSLESTANIVDWLAPKVILFVSFAAQRRMLNGNDFKAEELKRENGVRGWLLSSGEFRGIHSFAMCHPTMPRFQPTQQELELVGEKIRAYLSHRPAASS